MGIGDILALIIILVICGISILYSVMCKCVVDDKKKIKAYKKFMED
jgi:hypothetical protein